MDWIPDIFSRERFAKVRDSIGVLSRYFRNAPPVTVGLTASCRPDADGIHRVLHSAYEREKNNCSGFLRDVANGLDVPLAGIQADNQIDYMDEHWAKLKDGLDALENAESGWLVVAGLKSNEFTPPDTNGHVSVVVPGPTAHDGKYPTVWSGSSGNARSSGDKTLNYIFPRSVRDSVRYYRSPSKPCLN